jgi:alpha-ketoglutarate-dependent 2,4-dichlorophenoxyacetate dioxygenase
MPLVVNPLHPLLGAEVSGIDLRQGIEGSDLAGFIRAMDGHAVCVVRHQTPLTNEQHIAFSEALGPIERGKILEIAGADAMRIPRHEIIDQSNLGADGEIFREGDRILGFKRANRLWHTDMSFHPVRATYSALSAHEVPPGGADTEFADMRAAYDALPGETKTRIADLTAEHSYWHSRVKGGGPEPTAGERRSRPPARHKLVHVHPTSGRIALYLASHASHIVGWPVEDGQALLEELMAFATQPQFVYRHEWRVGDVVIWDNLATMHRATPFDDITHRRDMRRTTCCERHVPL